MAKNLDYLEFCSISPFFPYFPLTLNFSAPLGTKPLLLSALLLIIDSITFEFIFYFDDEGFMKISVMTVLRHSQFLRP